MKESRPKPHALPPEVFFFHTVVRGRGATKTGRENIATKTSSSQGRGDSHRVGRSFHCCRCPPGISLTHCVCLSLFIFLFSLSFSVSSLIECIEWGVYSIAAHVHQVSLSLSLSLIFFVVCYYYDYYYNFYYYTHTHTRDIGDGGNGARNSA